jgi:hypothetical protein
MTLKEKIHKRIWYHTGLYKSNLTNEISELADDYAIEILESYHNSLFNIPLKEGEAKEILKHLKK